MGHDAPGKPTLMDVDLACRALMRDPSSATQLEITSNLLTREPRTLQFIAHFLSDNTDIRVGWVVGVLVDEFSDREVRNFCSVVPLLGKLKDHFDRDEMLGLAKGLSRYLPEGAELSDISGTRVAVASALAKLTATVWLYAPESQLDEVTDSTEHGIYLTDSRTADLIMAQPEKLDEIIAFIREYNTGRHDDIVRHFAIASVLRVGDL